MIEKYLNIRNSLRDLSDTEFDSVVAILAKELETVSYEYSYTDRELLDDWKKLCKWSSDDFNINSTSRIGMKLCEHFFPNFYDIENNKGDSFKSLWKQKNLEKILRWNRKGHSTPYLSELKRGIYFCCGLTKNTMFRPQLAKLACMHYMPNIVLDPCAGWGGRMLGSVAYGAKYIAFEPNTETYNNLLKLISFLNIQDRVTLICDDALNMEKYDLPKVDMVITSPPYFDLEIYSHEENQSHKNISSYAEWNTKFFQPLMKKSTSFLNEDGVSCWNVGKVGKNDMRNDVLQFHAEAGYNHISTINVISSKRQSLQNANKNVKSFDMTDVFSKSTIKTRKNRLFED